MSIAARPVDRIKLLEPLSGLSPAVLERLLAESGELREFRAGEQILVEGGHDDTISYLLSGRVERSVEGRILDLLDADREPRRRPLDDHPQKRDTVRALSRGTLLRLNRNALEQACSEATDTVDQGSLEVLDISSDTSTDWHTRLLRSHIFTRLSAAVIQQVFDRMEELPVAAGQEVIRQGDPGAHYYVVQSGVGEVVRRPSADGQEVHLADVGPGSSFGEESLISGAPRNATVRMVSAGKVMRLDKADFLDLVVTPMVQGVSASQGRWLVEQGGTWVDVRGGRAGNGHGHGIDGALHIPMHLLRLQARRLDPDGSYVVCGENVNTSLLAAFLLAERGFEVAYLEQPLSRVILETKLMDDTDATLQPARLPAKSGERPVSSEERLSRDEFADTGTGEELADLIDELDRQRDALAGHRERSADTAPNAGDAQLQALAARFDPPHAAPPTAAGKSPLEPGEIVASLLGDVNQELGRVVGETLARQRHVLEERLARRLADIERAATERMQIQAREMEARHAAQLREKERELAAAYDRLASLANRFSHQKADIQKSRRALEEMLRRASRVHQEVYRMGNTLVEQVGHLDGISDPAQEDGSRH